MVVLHTLVYLNMKFLLITKCRLVIAAHSQRNRKLGGLKAAISHNEKGQFCLKWFVS